MPKQNKWPSFLFHLSNHNEDGKRSLEDVIGILGQQLRALGHHAVWDPSNDKFDGAKFLSPAVGFNVIVEGFTPYIVEHMANAYNHGARFLILATEEPTEQGFNHGTQIEMIKRQEIFPQAAKYCEGIIHLVPGEYTHNWYSKLAPAAYTELGYAPALVRNFDAVPTHDFGFYGSITQRRMQILRRLAKRANLSQKAVRIVGDFATQADRDRQMQEARVIVQVRKFEKMGLVSSSRCNTSLCLGRPVIAEPHELAEPWNKIVRFTSSMEDFYDTCLFARAMWKDLWRSQFERFKAMLPPEACIGQALAEIGAVERLKALAS